MSRVTALPKGGVVIDASTALKLCDALLSVNDYANRHGAMLNSELLTLTAEITSAVGSSEEAPPALDEAFEYELIDAKTAAELLGCTERNIRDLANRHRIPGRKVAGRWQFNREDVEVYRDYR